MDFGLTLMDGAVLQRTRDNVSEHLFSGSAEHHGRIFLSVLKGDKSKVIDNQLVGECSRNKIRGCLSGIPAGGPYALHFSLIDAKGKVLEQVKVADVLVGDLWILAGQSNMQGHGFQPDMTPVSPLLHNFYMDNRWGVSSGHLHNREQAAAPVHGGNPNFRPSPPLRRTVGPGMSFASAMMEATGVPQGTIACAHGGTMMLQWNPELKHLGGHSFYGAMMERVMNLGGRVSGMIWYQGCNDANFYMADDYKKRFQEFIRSIRKDLKAPKLPIVFAQLNSFSDDDAPDDQWSLVRQAQLELGRQERYVQCVPTIDLDLEDPIHLSSAAQQILGRRMASAMQFLLGMPQGLPSIELSGMKLKKERDSERLEVHLEYRNVVGCLRAEGRPFGFSTPHLGNYVGRLCPHVELDGNKVHIRTAVEARHAENFFLAYGLGAFAAANITDEANRSLPCFMLPLKKPKKGLTPMVTMAEVSEPVYGDESLESLGLPPEGTVFIPAVFNQFYLLHPRRFLLEISEHKVFYFRFRTKNSTRSVQRILLGADAPFALFCDRKELLRLPSQNPLKPDAFSASIELEAGSHEWVVALSGNEGKSWGICARFQTGNF